MAGEPDDVDAMIEPVVPSRHRWLAGLLAAAPGDRVADLGCGTGGSLVQAAPSVPGGLLARLNRPSQPLAWYLPAAGQLSITAGDAINYTYQWLPQVEPPYPSVADGLYLACYALLATGLLLLVRERGAGRDVASLIDATIITTGVGLLSWVFLIGPTSACPT